VSELTWDSDFERINRHRALAELVIHNRNWLPWWVICPVLDDFSDQGERYLRGEGLPPLPVRLWWAYRHWKFKRRHRSRIAAISGPINPMQVSNITGDRFTPASVIPLAPGQRIEYIPVRAEDHHHEISVMDMKSGKRRTVRVTDQMLNDVGHHLWDRLLPELDPEMRRAVWQGSDGEEDEIDATTVTDLKRRSIKAKFPARPTDLGSFPRPNCPKCHTPNPELGTPLDPDSPSGWGDSFFTCSNYKCRHHWKWRKVFPLLEENKNKEGTVTGTLVKGVNVPFHLFGKAGATIEQVNEAVRKIANVAGISTMTPEQQVKLQEIIQGGDDHDNICNFNGLPLARVTPSRKPMDRPATVI
jgi:hypothetical protein